MALVYNAADYAVDLTTGRMLAPKATVNTDISPAHEQALIARGVLLVVDGAVTPPEPAGKRTSVVARIASGATGPFEIATIDGGNLGATPALSLAGARDALFTGTLTANATITVSGLVPGARFRLVLKQDGTGGRTATLSDGVSTLSLPVNATAAQSTILDCVSPNGTDILVKT